MLVAARRLLRRLFGRAEGTAANSADQGNVSGIILNALDDWICGLDSEGRILYSNAALARNLCHTPIAPTGARFFELIPAAARDVVGPALQRLTSTGVTQTCEHETPHCGRGGSWRQWTFRSVAERALPGTDAPRVLAIGRDITEQKRLEQQFLQSQRMGSIGMLTSGIAHDLNNVLAPVVMSVDLLRFHDCSEENRALLDVVATSAQRGAALVAQMLSFSRGLEGDRQVVDLASLIKEIGRFVGRTFAKNIQLRVEVARDLWRLHANATQIYQVLLNLCVNARDAMPEGGQLTLTARNITLGEITAAALPGGTAGNFVELSVADTGTGIAKEIAGRIFDPFFTTKTIGAGTGLGLSTVRGIVKACGGVITLSTQVGCGTTFHVYFPVHELAQEVAAGPAVMENAFGAGEHVLVVDDETSFCDITRRLLEEFGYVVHVAANGAEAVRIFEKHRVDIAVTVIDLDMPVMDGRAAIKASRAADPHARIITVSGSIDSTDQPGDEGLEVRLKKPYSMGTLLQTLRQVLSQPAQV